MAELAVISTIASIAGTAITAGATLAAGKAQQKIANYEAQQLEIKAKEEQAASQIEAQQLRRQKNLALSKLQTRAAASGFSATDPTALNLAEDIQRYGTFQEQVAQYGGKSRRVGLEAQAAGRRFEGAVAKQNAKSNAFGTILGGISSFAKNYGGGFSGSGSSYYYG